MAMLERTDVSCGAQELYNLYSVDKEWLTDHLRSPYKKWGQRNASAASDGYIYKGETIFFSDTTSAGNGIRLASLIRKYDLGRVVRIRTRNPNTGNEITSYLWCYNGNKVTTTKVVSK